jgi:hypothetical protein
MSANCLKSMHLPSITGAARERPDVAEAEHGGSVRHHGNAVALDRELERLRGIGGDRHRHARDARRVDLREIGARLDRDLRLDVILPPRCARKVESETLTRRTPSSRSIDLRTALATASEATVTVTSRVTAFFPTERMSTASMIPPASPTADAREPNAPMEDAISRRMMSV